MKEPRLYILMRTDMASMTPGRACAQAAHAQSKFNSYVEENIDDIVLQNSYYDWENDNDFGVVIILAVESYSQLFSYCVANSQYYSGIVIDSEYSLKDGVYTHIVSNVPTCGWIFCAKEKAEELFKELELY